MGPVHSAHTIRLEFASVFEMVDVVQVVSDHVGRMMGLDDDGLHWLGVAVRESVINAIKHGNANDARKRVHVIPGTGSNSLRIDIPKNDVPEENLRTDGVEYFDGDDDRFSDRRPADKLLNEIFGKPGK